jgi:hypothetical protein
LSEDEVLSNEWRRAHVKKGDDAMVLAYGELANPLGVGSVAREMIQIQVAIAQAHYLAANVRARPDVTT